jgi:hypothetical protein
MNYSQKIKPFFKKKYVWIPLLAISIILQLIGIATLIGIHYYQLKPIDTSFGSWQYSYELSEKAALDTWKKNTNLLQNDPIIHSTTTYGEFRTWVKTTNDKDGKDVIKAWSSSEGYIIGFLYINEKKYAARLYPQTGEITYDQNESYERPHWRWYHWMGFRPNLLMSSIMDVVRMGLTK